MKTLLLLGATGLVGGHVLRLALSDPRVGRVIAPTRRALPSGTAGKAGTTASARHDHSTAAPTLENPVIDPEALPAEAAWWRADAAICTLGTTLRKAGSKAAFRHVDVDLVIAMAALAQRHGTPAFALNTSLDADARARNFYLRCKGEAEDGVRALGFASLTLVRPSLIDGDRDESRPLEHLGIVAARVLRPVIPARYRMVAAGDIARCLLEHALRAQPGECVVESHHITADTAKG